MTEISQRRPDVFHYRKVATISHPAVTMAEDMQINPQRAKQLAENIASISSRINAASKGGKQVGTTASPTTHVASTATNKKKGAPHSSIEAEARK